MSRSCQKNVKMLSNWSKTFLSGNGKTLSIIFHWYPAHCNVEWFCTCVTVKHFIGTMETDSMDYIIAQEKEKFPLCYSWLICVMVATDTSMTIVTGFLNATDSHECFD